MSQGDRLRSVPPFADSALCVVSRGQGQCVMSQTVLFQNVVAYFTYRKSCHIIEQDDLTCVSLLKTMPAL